MAFYAGDIALKTTVNLRSLEKAALTIGRIQSLAAQVRPLNLLAPGSGAGADKVKTNLESIRKVAKAIGNENATAGIGKLSSTFAGASQQAQVFSDVLKNINLQSRQAGTDIEIFGKAFAEAEVQARKLGQTYDEVVRKFRNQIVDVSLPERQAGNRFRTTQGRKSFEKDVAAQLQEQLSLEDKIVKANVSKETKKIALQRLDEAAVALQRRQLQSAQSLTSQAADQLGIDQKRTREAFRRRDAIRSIRKERRETIAGSAIIGGGFPLLFGQGPAAALGGALGGAGGGAMGGQFGFGLSLIGTQLGVVIDGFIADAANLGQALTSVTADIDAVVAASGKANTTFAANVKALEEAGLKNTALELATQQLSLVVGDEGVESLKTFGNETADLSRVFSQAMAQMQSSLAGLINSIGIVNAMVEGVSRQVAISAATSLAKDDPELAKALKELQKEQSSPAFGAKTMGVGGLITQKATSAEQKVVDLTRKNLERQAANINNLSELALKRKNDLEESKRQLSGLERSKGLSDQILSLTKGQKEAQQAQSKFEDQRNNIKINYEKSIASLRRNVENQVSSLRLQNLKKANQIEDQRASNALTQLRNQQTTAQLFDFSTGASNPLLQQEAESLKAAADAYQLKILETEQKKAKLERSSALAIENIQLKADKFKLDVARQSAELALNAQKQIDKINKSIVERNAKFTIEKFNVEKTLAILRLQVLKRELEFEQQKLTDQEKTATGVQQEKLNNQRLQNFELQTDVSDSVKTLNQVGPPPSIEKVAGVAKAGVDLREFNELTQQGISLQESFGQARLNALNLIPETEGIKSLTDASNLIKSVQNEITNGLARRVLEEEKSLRISELTRQLGSKAIAEEIAGIEFSTQAQVAKLDLVANSLEIQRAQLELVSQDRELTDVEIKQLERILTLEDAIAKVRGQVGESAGISKKQAKDKGELNTFIEQATNELNNLEAVGVRVAQGIGDAIGGSLASGISGLIEGSATVKDVFADMLKSIGQTLVQEGTKMIATYIAIGIAKAFAGIVGGGGDAGAKMSSTQYFNPQTGLGVAGPNFGLANGGPAEGGQPYMVGERGPELFVPGQSGGVMRNEDMRSLMGRSPASGGAASMNFSFETTSIGGTEYVSREQLESAMAVTRKQASNDGAKRGMNMTLDKMQNSPRTRTRIGLR